MKKLNFYILLLITLIALSGCKKKNTNDDEYISKGDKNNDITTITPVPTQITPEVTKAPVVNHNGQVISKLTGLWVDEKLTQSRPLAVVFNNYRVVRNQSGISQADIVYEGLVEGGITRLLGIGENFTGDRIGSARSARHYFVSVASEYDAIYVHFGKTKYAVSKMNELHIDNLDGTSGVGSTVFYRDRSMNAPHNAFSSIKGIRAGIKQKRYRTKLKDNVNTHFRFFEKDTNLSSKNVANKVTMKFSAGAISYFDYNKADKNYYAFQYREPHKDSVTGKQLRFKNLLVQFVREWNIDHNGYQTMDLTNASGRGCYFTNGKMVPITWKKKEATGFMQYYNEAGEVLKINPGKTYIALFPNDRTKDVVLQ